MDKFIKGMDVSSLPEETALGARFYDEGKEGDALEILKKYGANSLRIRLWNDPYSEDGKPYSAGTSDFTKLVALASAGKKLGYSYLLDLHYSDFWADPGKQYPPKEWAYADADALEKHVYDYTKDVLLKLKRLDLLPEMVQVGNEITNGLMWPHGKWDNVDNIARFISAGIRAVREVSPDSRVMLHLDCGGNNARCREWFDAYVQRGEDFDVIGLSYYPFWHGTIDDLTNNMNDLSQRYQKDVIVAEVSMGFTMEDYADREKLAPKERKGMATKPNLAEAVEYPMTPEGQAAFMQKVMERIAQVPDGRGKGFYYWEPAWLTVGNTKGLTGDAYDAQVKENQEKWEKYGSGWASSYANEYDSKDAGKWYGGSAVDNEAMFYPDGTATPALHVWNYVKTGAVSNLVSVEGFDSALTQTITAGSDFTLPDSVEVTYSDSKTPVAEAVTWDEASVKKADMSKPGTYQIPGTVSLSKEITRGAYKGKTSVDVTLTLQVKYANLITNKEAVEFDRGEYFTVDGATFKGIPSAENAKSGKNSMGWYGASAANGSVTYKEAITLEKGTYTLEAYAQGAQSDVTMQILNAEDDSVLFTGETTAMTAWGDWHTPKVTFTLDKTKSVKLRVCVEHEDGGWGAVDVLYLHKDASSSEGKDDTNTSGSSSSDSSSSGSAATVTPSDDTKKDDKPEQTTESKNVTATTASGEKAEVTVIVTKDTAGKVTEASAEVTGTKAEISADMVSRIVEAAGTDHVAITANVTDKEGNIRYTVTADAKDLTAGNKLSVVVVDKKTGAYKLVNAKTYTVGKDGTLHVNLAAGSDYRMLSAAEIKNVEKAVLKTVAVKKTTASIKAGKNTKIQLSSKLDLDNVKKITYTSGKKSVAAVDKNGKITAKKKGTVTIKAKVTLKNGKTKTVSMKIKVK